jgi:hypothetical protein
LVIDNASLLYVALLRSRSLQSISAFEQFDSYRNTGIMLVHDGQPCPGLAIQ